MKDRLCLCVFFAAVVFAATGCATPPPEVRIVRIPDVRVPLTIELTETLVGGPEFMADDIRRFQLYLFGRISLVRESSEQRDVNITNDGRATIENLHRREELILGHQTPGLVLNVEQTGGKVLLYVAFEASGDNTLVFSAARDNPDGFFSLEYNSANNTINYGGATYRLSYTSKRPPFLMVGLDQNDTPQSGGRQFSGRRLSIQQSAP
jgi:hypothetical protein